MSNQHLTAAIKCREFTGTTRTLLLVLADSASNGESRRGTKNLPFGYTSKSLLGMMEGINTDRSQTVSDALKELRDAGPIKTIHRRNLPSLTFVDIDWLELHASADEDRARREAKNLQLKTHRLGNAKRTGHTTESVVDGNAKRTGSPLYEVSHTKVNNPAAKQKPASSTAAAAPSSTGLTDPRNEGRTPSEESTVSQETKPFTLDSWDRDVFGYTADDIRAYAIHHRDHGCDKFLKNVSVKSLSNEKFVHNLMANPPCKSKIDRLNLEFQKDRIFGGDDPSGISFPSD